MIQLTPVFPPVRHDQPAALQGSRGQYLPRLDKDGVSLPATVERPRLLLVEEDPATRATLTEALSRHYQVEGVSDGLAAWQAVRRQPPAMVILDLCAPGKDSLIFIRSLREGIRTTTLPIILLTVGADRELLLRCLATGASNFMLKPFGLTEFLAFVRVELELQSPLAGARGSRATLREAYA